MHHDQTVSGMADDILGRQAKARVARTGEPLEEALAAVLKTEASRHLQNLREGPHHNERAADWQENLPREGAKERT
jgi:hypothetical protein